MTKKAYLSGVGGWLTLLIFGLMVLGPLVGLGHLSGEFNDVENQYPQLLANAQWVRYKQLSWLVLVASASLSIAAGYRLWKIHCPESVRFAILSLWIVGPLSNALYFISSMLVFGWQTTSSILPETLSSVFGACIAVGIWTAYLMRSIRVRNTFKMELKHEFSDNYHT